MALNDEQQQKDGLTPTQDGPGGGHGVTGWVRDAYCRDKHDKTVCNQTGGDVLSA